MNKTKKAPWPPVFLVELWELKEKMARETETMTPEEIAELHGRRAAEVEKEIEEIRRKRHLKRKVTPAIPTAHPR